MKLEDIDVTKTYWFTSLSFSNQSFRVVGSTRPIEVKLSADTEGETNIKLSLSRAVDGSYFRNFYFSSYSINNDLELYGIFETEEEAIEYWNKQVLTQIDKLQNYYENKSKYLANKKIKKK